jgi:hypothetical protein
MKPAVLLCLVPMTLAACASDPRPTHERGWIGGRLTDVSRGIAVSGDAIHAMPGSMPNDAGALVAECPPDTPLAAAGLAPADLVLAVDGGEIDGGLDLRRRTESMAPGSHAHLTYWRAGEVKTADVVVGRETYEEIGKVTVGLALDGRCDLWPFDDGIDVFGLVRWDWDERRGQLDSAEAAYCRAVDPARETPVGDQESTEVFVVPFGLARGKRVLRQETLP